MTDPIFFSTSLSIWACGSKHFRSSNACFFFCVFHYQEELDYDEDALLGNSDDETAAQDGLEGLEDLDDNDIIELEILDVDPE